MNGSTFSKGQIEALLAELGTELEAQGVRAEMFIVGGAAMALAYNTRRATQDIDAVFHPTKDVYVAAKRVGDSHGLHDGWLNDGVKGMLPGPDPDERTYYDSAGISVSVASPQYLLALKVAAARVDRDADDIRVLAKECGLTTADEILATTEKVMGARHRLLPKAQFLIQEMFPPPVPQPSKRARLLGMVKDSIADRAKRRAARPPKPAKPMRVRCGQRTAGGRSCRNWSGSCPHH